MKNLNRPINIGPYSGSCIFHFCIHYFAFSVRHLPPLH